MTLASILSERLSKLNLFCLEPDHGFASAETSVDEFVEAWRALGCEIIEQQLQCQLEAAESKYQGSSQRRSKTYQTPLGPIELTRRVYGRRKGECRGEQALSLPSDGWFTSVKELSCALGVSSEFAHANVLLQKWSRMSVSEKTLANHVERYGAQWVEATASSVPQPVCPVISSVTQATTVAPQRPVFYIGADGIHTPMRQGGTREAKVAVMFWQADHLRLSNTRAIVKRREYIATLEGVERFREQLNRCYAQTVQQRPHQVVFLGDGAPWIWLMATLLFPDCIQILDFFHVSEYLWQVARQAFESQENQKGWVDSQQEALKKSQWSAVIKAAQRLPPGTTTLRECVERLERYLTANQGRIDYHGYLQQGLMIGSGVVESSNRRIVTQRLKQSGMFWSQSGAEAVMSLRAGYLSSSQNWQHFWTQHATCH
jgi:hypothetical protein